MTVFLTYFNIFLDRVFAHEKSHHYECRLKCYMDLVMFMNPLVTKINAWELWAALRTSFWTTAVHACLISFMTLWCLLLMFLVFFAIYWYMVMDTIIFNVLFFPQCMLWRHRTFLNFFREKLKLRGDKEAQCSGMASEIGLHPLLFILIIALSFP